MDQDTNDENLLLFAMTKVKEQSLKRNYDKFISRRIKEDLNEEEKMQFWPKYLGSLKIECQLYQNFEHLAILVKSGQIIRFKPRKIQWHSKNLKKSDGNGKLKYTIKNESLYIDVSVHNQNVGVITTAYEEMFVFLLHMDYISMKGMVISSPEPNQPRFEVIVDIYLTEEVLLNPLNSIVLEEDQKVQQLYHFAKESFNKLFSYLNLKVLRSTAVQLKNRTDLFSSLRHKKYGGRRSSNDPKVTIINCYYEEPKLITQDYPQYYRRESIPELKKEMPEEEKKDSDKENAMKIENKNFEEDNFAKLEERPQRKMKTNDLNRYKPVEKIEDSFGFSDDEYSSSDDKMGLLERAEIQRRQINKFFNSLMSLREERKKGNDLGNSLNDLFNLQDFNDFSLPPQTFKTELYPFQKQALIWMKFREGCFDGQTPQNNLNEEIKFLNDFFQEIVLIDGSKIFFNPFNGEITIDFPEAKPTKGGILADEMGLGKTIMALALIHSHKRKENNKEEAEPDLLRGIKKVKKSIGSLKKAGTLIVMPATVMSQWEAEIFTHSHQGTIKVFQYYGYGKNKVNLDDFDIVLTTYRTLSNEYVRKKQSRLFSLKWFRVILDESHFIKGRRTKSAKAACGLEAEYRWCLSGTPLQNNLDDLFSMIRFLKVDTWGEENFWNEYISKYIQPEEAAYEVIEGIFQSIFLRRTKESTYNDGRNILELPPKEIKTIKIILTEEERLIYEDLLKKGKIEFDRIVSGGTIQSEYAYGFRLIMKLRQVCNHPSLGLSSENYQNTTLEDAIMDFLDQRPERFKISSEFVKKTIGNLDQQQLDVCGVCLDVVIEPFMTNCCHIFCKGCISQAIEMSESCPYCRKKLTMEDVAFVNIENNRKDFEDFFDMKKEDFKKSSKLVVLMEIIKEIKGRGEKVVIFSQFVEMLNLIERCLEEENIKFRRIDGNKTLKERTRYIDEFKADQEIVVFMISLKAGAAGLNLTAANNCILVDPWWNPAVEDQAIERIYRIGQKNPVTVVRLICDETIEARILKLTDKKKELINDALKFNPEELKRKKMENLINLMKNFDD